MAGSNVSFKFDMGSLGDALLNGSFNDRAQMAMQMYAETKAKELEAYMKQNRPWTDRTGAAKARLHTSVHKVPEGYQIVLAHGVDYGIQLELAHEKKYAIIQPTILAKSNDVLKGFSNLLERL